MSQAPTKTHRLRLGPRSAGVLLTTEEFDRARFVEGWRYELINEVLVVFQFPPLTNVIRTKSWGISSGLTRSRIRRVRHSTSRSASRPSRRRRTVAGPIA